MQVLKMSGYSKEEIIGRAPGEYVTRPESNPEVILYLRNQIKKGLPLIVRSLIILKNKEKYCVFKDRLYMTKKGKIIKYFAIEEMLPLKKI
jgi:hypothetical protein